MSSTIDERCPKCGGTIGVASSGSITQWIAVCSCAAVKDGIASTPRMHICGRCGKRLNSGRAGSLTQWVFRQDICSCKEPIISKLDVETIDALPAPIDTSQTVTEIGLDISPSKFPFDRYFPIREIGKGGSGVVYYCRDRLLDKIVAVKTLHALNARELLSFQNEARATSSLKHANIVSVMDFGATAAGVPFMAMEYVNGVSMQQLISDRNLFEPDTVVRLFARVADALHHAHESGILHRDITTSNLLIFRDHKGEPDVRIIDFGVSMLGQNGQGQTMVGTPRYMPPDQARGEDYDECSEVYEFGCSLFEALTGDTPFLSESIFDLMRQHAEEPPPRLSDRRPDGNFSEELEAIVASCLAKGKAERFQSMGDLADALDELCVNLPRFEQEPVKPFDVFARNSGYVIASLMVVSGVVLAGKLGFEVFQSSEKLTEEKAIAVPDHGIFGAVLVDAASESLRPRFETHQRHGVDWTIAKGNVTNDSLVELARRTDIKRLSLLADPVDGRALIFILKLPLVGLDLDQTRMRDQDVGIICRFKQLETLGIANTTITAKGLSELVNLPKLTDLQIGGPLLNDQSLLALSKLKLRSLSLRDTKKITASGITKLSAISSLQSLTLRNLEVGPEIIGAVSGIKQLSQLYLYDQKLPEGALKTLSASNITDIKLRRSRLTDEHLEQIGQLKRLRYLDLEDTVGFTQEGLATFQNQHPKVEITLE